MIRKSTVTGKKDLYLTINVKETKSGPVFLVADDEGYVCGVFENEYKAKRAIPAIKRNLFKGRVAPQTLRPLKTFPKNPKK